MESEIEELQRLYKECLFTHCKHAITKNQKGMDKAKLKKCTKKYCQIQQIKYVLAIAKDLKLKIQYYIEKDREIRKLLNIKKTIDLKQLHDDPMIETRGYRALVTLIKNKKEYKNPYTGKLPKLTEKIRYLEEKLKNTKRVMKPSALNNLKSFFT
jgi:hypothetical protein